MTTMHSVTVWHPDESGFLCRVFHAHINMMNQIDKSGIKQKGFYSSSQCKFRIPTIEKIDVYVGDYVRVGEYSGNPDRTKDFKITEIADNRRGGTPHYRLLAER